MLVDIINVYIHIPVVTDWEITFIATMAIYPKIKSAGCWA